MAVFAQKETILFVGGIGTHVGAESGNVGGCTKEWWGDLKNPNHTLSEIMADNGEAKVSALSCSYTNADHKITKASAFDNTVVKAGMVVAVVEAGANITDERYEITAVDPGDNWIQLDNIVATGDSAGDVDVYIGGAHEHTQDAIDFSDAANYSVYMLTNLGGSETYPMDVDTGGGTPGSNTWKRIIGIDDTNGEELAVGSWVTYDAGGGATHVFNIDAAGIEFRHIYAYNTDENASNSGFYLNPPVTVRYGVVFRDCKATDCYYAVYALNNKIRGVVIIGGYYESTVYRTLSLSGSYGVTIIGVEIVTGSDNFAAYLGGLGGVTISGCVLSGDGTGNGMNVWGAAVAFEVHNNVFYNFTNCIQLAQGGMVEYNNIFMVTLKASGKAIENAGGQVRYSDYSCMWALDGAPVATDRWGVGGSYVPPNAVEANPLLVNPPTNVSIPNGSPCYETGKPRLKGNGVITGDTTMGCWEPDASAAGGGGSGATLHLISPRMF